MLYGQIFAETFKTIWRHKKLWVFGLLGYLLLALGNGIYFGMAFGWQRRWWDFFFGMPGRPLPAPLANQMVRGLAWLWWVGLGVLLLAMLCGYVVNLVMRGATISEAAAAWQGEQTQVGRGLRTGLRRAGHLFVIDILWWGLLAILMVAGYAVGVVLFLIMRAISGGWGPGGKVGLAFAGVLGLMLYVLALIVIAMILYGVFAPLMYQAVVQGRHNLGVGIREGWQLARANLGKMVVFWLLTVGVSLGLSLVASLLTLPLMAPWLANWFGAWVALMRQVSGGGPLPVRPLPGVSVLLVILAALGSALSGWLYGSLFQTFVLTMYAEVYRRLAGRPAPAEPAPSEPPEPPALAKVKDLGLVVPEEPAPPASEEIAPSL